jgi:hypothetical protein
VSLALSGEGRVIVHSKKLLEVGLELRDGGGRTQDIGGDYSDVSGSVVVRLVPQMAGFKVIKDFFRETAASTRFARH